MKKILALILTISISLGFAFSQENNEKYLGFIKDIRAGVFFNFEPTAGDLNEFASSTLGGGASLEIGIPLPWFGKKSIIHELFENFGASFRMAFDGAIMKETNIDSIFTMRYTVGAHTRIPLPGNMFFIVPEIDYGIAVNFPKASGQASKRVKNVYVDQILQFGAGLRFSHPKMAKGKLEFEFTPTYSFSPESIYSVHYIGFRLGALYKFGGKKRTASTVPIEENKPLNNSGNLENSEKIENSKASETLEKENFEKIAELTEKKKGLGNRAENLQAEFANLAEDAEENNIKKLSKKYKDYEKQVEKISKEIDSVSSEESIAAESKLNQLEGKIEHFEEIEEESEIELDMAVTEKASKTGHASLIHHPDGSYTIAIPSLTFEANTTKLVDSEENTKSLETLLEVLTTDERILNMTVSVFGYINPDSHSEYWTESEIELAKGRSETIARYLLEKGCNHKVDAHAGEGYTNNAVFNRRVEFLVHN